MVVIAKDGFTALAVLLGGATLIAVLGLSLVQAALTGIYSAALYRFASTGEVPGGFDSGALEEAFSRKE